MHLLLVEDDLAIADPLAHGLRLQGFDVHHETTGQRALDRLAGDEPTDAVLLDLGLPDLDGYEVCRQIRATSSLPIIVITARGDELDRVLGLELGADDYLVKPFGFRELVARIRAVARRSGGDRSDAGDLRTDVGEGVVIDTRARRVTVDGDEVSLTRKEFDLLAVLAEDPGATRTRDDILERVWDTNWYGPTKTLDVHIAALRRKLGSATLIETVRGVGFRLKEPERQDAPPERSR